jgi:hypothetical protein
MDDSTAQQTSAAVDAAGMDSVAQETLLELDKLEANLLCSPCGPAQPSAVSAGERVDAGVDATPATACVACLCTKCKLMKPVEGAAVAGPGFCCRQCNTKRSSLSQIFGYWPIQLFSSLPPSQQEAFWQSEARGKVEIQNALVKEVTDYRHEEERTSVGGKFLPLSVLKAKGFDVETIEKNCTDTEEHPVLGKTYNIKLKSIVKEDIQKKVWKDVWKYSGQRPTSSSKKEKKTKKKKRSKKSSDSSESKKEKATNKKKGSKRSSSSSGSKEEKETNKKKGSKKKSSATSVSSSSSSSNSNKSAKPTPAKQRMLDAQRRKEDQAAAKAAKQAEKAAEAARAKVEAAEAKAAAEEAKQRQKEKLASQATYTSLFNAHAQLVADITVVPFGQQADEKFIVAQENAAQGEEFMNECLEAMKNKTEIDKDGAKTMIAGLKKATVEVQKLLKKRRKKN